MRQKLSFQLQFVSSYQIALMASAISDLPAMLGTPTIRSLSIPIVFTILGLWVLYKVLDSKKSNSKTSRLPPGPIAWPIIGNMHQVGKLPHRSLCDLAKQYGPIMFMKLGFAPTVVVSSSEMAKQFLKTHDLAFANRPESAASRYVAYNDKNMGLAPYGDYWRHMRKVYVMELLSAKRVESFRSVREEEVYVVVKAIWEKRKNGKIAVNVIKIIKSLMSSIV